MLLLAAIFILFCLINIVSRYEYDIRMFLILVRLKWRHPPLYESYKKLEAKERVYHQKIMGLFNKRAVNVGSVAYGRWGEDSDLDLAIESDQNVLWKIYSYGFEAQEVITRFRGNIRTNYVITIDNVDIQIRSKEEIEYLQQGALSSLRDYTIDKHVMWIQKKEKLSREQLEVEKKKYYVKYIPDLYMN